MSLLLTTTVTTTIPELIDTDNQSAVFTHPVVDFDLYTKWSSEDIRAAAASLESEISSGNIGITYNGAPITEFALFGIGPGTSFFGIREVSASDNATNADDVVIFNGGSGQTITLPDPAGEIGQSIVVKNRSTDDLTVATAGGTIDGFATITILGNVGAAITFVSNNTEWVAI